MLAVKTLISEFVRQTERKRRLEEELRDAKARLEEMFKGRLELIRVG